MPRQATWRTATAAALAAAALAACGGGSDDADEASGPPPVARVSGAEGFWMGKASTGYDVALAVLDDGAVWGVYLREGEVQGMVHGTSTAADGRLRGSAADYDLRQPGSAPRSTVFEGTYTTRQLVQIGFGFDLFSGHYRGAYEQPASLASVAGVYLGHSHGVQEPVRIRISPHGAVASDPFGGCVVQGALAPRPGGRNIFDMRLTFSGTACAQGHATSVQGVAYHEDGGLFAMGVAALHTQAFTFLGHR